METKTRETTEFTTSGGHKIVHKTYLTGREFNEIERMLLKNTTVKLVDGEVNVEGLNVLSEKDKEQKFLEIMTVSVDGESHNALDILLDLPYEDYLQVITQYNDVTSKKKLLKE